MQDGVYAATLTPLLKDMSCDYSQLVAHCFNLVERGCKGIVLGGTTGEGSSFSVAERIAMLTNLIAAGFDAKKIILGNGSSCIQDTIELAKAALQQKCAALLVIPPCFYKNITDDGVLAFYRMLIHKVADPNLRIILYHIPQYTGVPISQDVVFTLKKEFPNIVVGIKESEGNLDFSKELLHKMPGFKVFVGNEKHIVETVPLGGAGSICGIANLYPELICALYEKGRENGVQVELLDAVFAALNGIQFIPAAKALMQKRYGGTWYLVRPPLIPLKDIQTERFVSALKAAGLE